MYSTAARKRLHAVVAGCSFSWRAAALSLAFAYWPASAADFSEDAIKAAYLHRFASYVYWPAEAQSTTPLVIAVFGADAVAGELNRLLPQMGVQARPAVVRKIHPGDEPPQMHILYVGPGQLSAARDLLLAIARQPVLVVTDDENGLARGGTINFVRVNRNVRFEVSLRSARSYGLKISSGLLSVAARIEDARQESAESGEE